MRAVDAPALQQAAHVDERAADAALHRAERFAGHLRDLGVRALLDDGEAHGAAAARRQERQRATERGRALLLVDLSRRVFVRGRAERERGLVEFG